MTFPLFNALLFYLTLPFWKGHLQYQRLPDSAPISVIDRFHNCTTIPTGLGTTDLADPRFNTILNAREIESALQNLEGHYDVSLTHAPYKSYWGYDSLVAHVKFKPSPTPRRAPSTKEKILQTVFLTSGFQGRERGGPDSLIYFISDLLYAYENSKGLTYGRVYFTHDQVRQALSQNIMILPMTNPDGLIWDQRHDNCWGKNLNLTMRKSSPFGTKLRGIGVNIDRNFDIAWDYKRIFSKKVTDVASDNPLHELYHGTEPFSEAESRNVAWVINSYPEIRWYMNIGTNSRVINHPWDISGVQILDPTQNWRNETYDGKRGDPDYSYGEFMKETERNRFHRVAYNIAEQVQVVYGKEFRHQHDVKEKSKLFLGASGTATDWAYSQHIVNKKREVYSLKFQFGLSDEEAEAIALRGGCPYYPTSEQYKRGMIEAAAGYMRFLLGVSEEFQSESPSAPLE